MTLYKTLTNRKNNQGGFGAAGVVALIVLVGIIGFTGWFVYNSSKQTDQTIGQTVGPDTQTPTTPVSDSAAPPTPTDTSVKTIKFAVAPKAIQDAVHAEYAASAPTCLKDGKVIGQDGKSLESDQIMDVKYTSSGFFETAISCGGASTAIFAKTGTTYTKVDSTSFEFKCANLQKYKVPVEFVKAVSPDPTQDVKCASDDPNATSDETYKL
jgi:hypothetical protein